MFFLVGDFVWSSLYTTLRPKKPLKILKTFKNLSSSTLFTSMTMTMMIMLYSVVVVKQRTKLLHAAVSEDLRLCRVESTTS